MDPTRVDAATTGMGFTGPTLSVVMVSSGSFDDLDRAISLTRAAIGECAAELIVVRADSDSAQGLPAGFDLKGAVFVQAPLGADRAALSDLAMQTVSGDIVAIREDLQIRDSGWLAQYVQLLRVPDRPDGSLALGTLGSLGMSGPADLPPAVDRRPAFSRDLRTDQSSARVAG